MCILTLVGKVQPDVCIHRPTDSFSKGTTLKTTLMLFISVRYMISNGFTFHKKESLSGFWYAYCMTPKVFD